MNGAFAGCDPSQILPVVPAAAKVIDAQGHIYAAIAHKVLYDDNPPPPPRSSPYCLLIITEKYP